MPKPKALFWSIYVDIIFDGVKPPEAIGGADVQLAFWARCFMEKGWKSYSFYYRWNGMVKQSRGLFFLYIPLIRKLMILLNYIKYIWLFVIRPDIVVVRTRAEKVSLLRHLSRILNFKLVYMIASDDEFRTTDSKKHKRKQSAIRKVPYVIAQNEYQKQCFEKAGGPALPLPIIPNIWYSDQLSPPENSDGQQRKTLVWVSNLRELKRPEWFIDLARDLPDYDFQMIGAVLSEKLYEACKEKMKDLDNIAYLGYKHLQEVNRIVARSELLVCTSHFEGFPNVFLQAWSYQVPVLSTVNPGQVITDHNLGVYSEDYEGLLRGARKLLSDSADYRAKQNSIGQYFSRSHHPETGYKTLMDYLSSSKT